MNERDRCVDVARGLGIALVVLGHNPLVLHGPTGEPFRVIYSFHMPLFFFLSGTFFNARRPWWESALGRADALLKPYVVTLLAFAFADLLLGGQEFWMHLLRMAYATGEALQSGWVPLWFLPHLFVLSLVGWCALRALGRRTALVRWTWTAALLVAGVASIDLAWRREVSIFGAQIALPGLPFSVDLLPVTLSFRPDGWQVVWHEAVPHTDVPTMTQAVADAFAVGIAEHPADWHMLQRLWLDDLAVDDPRRARLA